jgi:hypothetical protein
MHAQEIVLRRPTNSNLIWQGNCSVPTYFAFDEIFSNLNEKKTEPLACSEKTIILTLLRKVGTNYFLQRYQQRPYLNTKLNEYRAKYYIKNYQYLIFFRRISNAVALLRRGYSFMKVCKFYCEKKLIPKNFHKRMSSEMLNKFDKIFCQRKYSI